MLRPVYLFLFLLLFLASGSLHAKLNRDSLWTVYSDSHDLDTNRLKAMHALSWSFVFSDPDSSIVLARMQLEFARSKDQPKYISGAMNTIGVAFMNLGKLDSSLAYHQNAYDIRIKSGDRRGCAVSLNNLGTVMYQRGDYLRAIDYYQRSLTIKEELKDMSGVAAAFSNLSLIYQDQKNWPKAKIYVERALAIRDSLHDDRGVADAYSSLGAYYMSTHDLDQSLKYIKLSVEYYLKTTDVKGLANGISNLGLIFQKRHQPDSARVYYLRAAAIREKAKDKEGQASSDIALGLLSNETGNGEEGVRSCLKALEIADDIGFPDLQRDACDCLATAYELAHQPDQALKYMKRATLLKDSLNDIEKMKALTSMDLQYDFQKKELRDSVAAARQNALKESEHKAEIDRQRTYLWIGGAGLVLMIIIAVSLFRGSRQKQRNNELLENKNRIITEQMAELGHQKELIEEKQEQILDSIHYAKRLQDAQLPTEKYIHNKLEQLKD
ncbi:MAG TPA: tetratricopeptide repeat protein [Bacteroidia bacterium]|jgi:tetratricopeptide (TPR) repeat protein|nr:tetratricopeptide repeat protein [Bacteroidia bacterium]